MVPHYITAGAGRSAAAGDVEVQRRLGGERRVLPAGQEVVLPVEIPLRPRERHKIFECLRKQVVARRVYRYDRGQRREEPFRERVADVPFAALRAEFGMRVLEPVRRGDSKGCHDRQPPD